MISVKHLYMAHGIWCTVSGLCLSYPVDGGTRLYIWSTEDQGSGYREACTNSQLVTSLTDLLANINRGLCGYAILLHDRYRGCARPSKKEEEGEGYTGHVRVEKRRREKGIGS